MKHTRFFWVAWAPKEPQDMEKSSPNRLFPREIGWEAWFLRKERAGAQEGRLWVPPNEAELSFLMEPPSCTPRA